MKALQLLRERREHLLAQRSSTLDALERIANSALSANRSLSNSETGEIDALRSTLTDIDDDLAGLDAREAELDTVHERTVARAGRPALHTNTLNSSNPWSDLGRTDSMSEADWRSAAISMIERSTNRLGDPVAEQLTGSIESGPDAANVAKVVAAGSDPEYRTAFLKVARDEQRGHMEFTDAERFAWTRAQDTTRAMGIASDGIGGAMVPTHLDPAVMITNAGVADPMRDIARIVQIATPTWNGVSSAGVTASWDTEAEEVSDDSPTLVAPSIDVHAARVFVPFSWELYQDVSTLEFELAKLAADAYARLEGAAFWTGSGSDEPEGVITKLDATAASEVAVGTADAYHLDDVYKVHGELPARYRRGAATWAANIDVLDRTRRFGEGTTGSNSAYWADLGPDVPPTLLGHNVVEASSMVPHTGTGVENILVIGDFSAGYVVVDRVGTMMAHVPMLFSTTNGRPTYEAGAAFFRRTGGGVVDAGAFRLLQS